MSRDKRPAYRLNPTTLVDVVQDEVAVELPIRPGEAMRLGFAADGRGVTGAGLS